MVNSLAPL